MPSVGFTDHLKHRARWAAVCGAILLGPQPGHAQGGFNVAATPEALAAAMATRRSVLLGEVHDNAEQHALRVEALRQRIAAGARPAIAFEQFDRDRQIDIDRLRREEPGNADALITAAGASSWQWKFYRPFVQLALDHDLPIVAANLSRGDAMKVANTGWGALFDVATQKSLGLDRLADAFIAAHERTVARGHCDLLPAELLPSMARAQIARDIVLARSLRAYLDQGVVLLTGNGHARKDIGVPVWLDADERRDVVTIGLIEADAEGSMVELRERYDVVIETSQAERLDPCEALRKRFQPPTR
jgi:uncharacterized iron-regulated protein